jgi:cation transport ATPase
VARRRRRRERRDAGEHRLAKPDKHEKRSEDKRRDTFEADQKSLRRRRTFIGALAFIPLGGALGCGVGVQLLCQIPQEWWLAIWAALFGSFLGITIRLFLERRKFRRGVASG